ncbi:MAG: cysteine-rich CWC family protein [Gemmatimonadales bacterium]
MRGPSREGEPLTEPGTCPLCGEPNACVMAAGPSSSPCWCEAIEISQEILDRIPPADRGQVCLCARCAAKGPGEP